MSIDITGVTKKYGDFVALEDVNVSIPTGQLTALLGPSGGGKSTLLRIIAGLDTADSGTISIEGTNATKLPPQKRNVGFVFQHYAAFKHMSVAKNVAYGLEIRKRSKAETKRRVDELLELVHLSQFSHRLPSQLSGGMVKRAALARAHDLGVIHRDLKSDNILLTGRGGRKDFVKILDFGLAHLAMDPRLAPKGAVFGTPEYMSPEQARGEEAGPQSDLYALGVLFFEMLTGHPPYGGDTPLAVAYQHVHNDVPAPSTEVPGLP